MSTKPHWIPEGEPQLSPSLAMVDAWAAIDFYKEVFGAQETMRFQRPDGFVDHAQLAIGDSRIMIASHDPEWNANPAGQAQASVTIHVYVEDVDTTFERAIQNGATVRVPVSDQFYGMRSGRFQDPFGHIWVVATQTEVLTTDQMLERYGKMMGS